jgi:hypothetical protein
MFDIVTSPLYSFHSELLRKINDKVNDKLGKNMVFIYVRLFGNAVQRHNMI